jgi:hypothetical protein
MRLAHRASVVLALLCVVGVATTATAGPTARSTARTCSTPAAGRAYVARIEQALGSGRDLLGERILAAPDGPTYRSARVLAPLFFARGRDGRRLTRSGVHYVALGPPGSLVGEKAFGLHVADGSEIVTRRVGGPALRLVVGARPERYGSCVRRLGGPTLLERWLPVLRTTYVDAAGVRYRQESFVARVPGLPVVASYVRLHVDARASGPTVVRIEPSVAGLVRVGDTLSERGAVRLAFTPGARFDGASLRYAVREDAVIDLAWIHVPRAGLAVPFGPGALERARGAVVPAWQTQVGGTPVFDVPDPLVVAAERNLLVQQVLSTWRYSIGNSYEELSFAEALGSAEVMAEYGRPDVSRAVLRFALRRLPARFTAWRAGAALEAAGRTFALERDSALVDEAGEVLSWASRRLGRQIDRPGGTGLLDREQYSTDIARPVIGFHQQAAVWAGLRQMAVAWRATGHPHLAARAETLAARLGSALRAAVGRSKRTLPDGSVFVPAALLDHGAPFDRVADTREGSYWNLVIPYALASGILPPQGKDSRGLVSYMARHGSWLAGLVRARADTLYLEPQQRGSGSDEVYGLALARFLANEDESDRLALALYGILANGMTPGTFVSGEAASVAPLGGEGLRTMYLPPNSGANAAFLETLRLLLVQERVGERGRPGELDLAFATPRSWLERGKRIRVIAAPTAFGPVSYTIRRAGHLIRVELDAPPVPRLRLRLRLPRGERLRAVHAMGARTPFDRQSGTLDPSALPRRVSLVASVTAAR